MKYRSTLIPLLCVVLAVMVLYGKTFIPHGRSSPSLSNPTASSPPEDIITIHYHERPPYYMTGPLGVYGLCADPAKLAFKHANIKFQWAKTPARRQMDILKHNNSTDCLLGWFKNPEREKFAKFTHPIYQDKPTIALARADNNKLQSNKSLEEIFRNPDLILLRKNGYSYGEFIDTKIAKLNPRQVMTNAENIGMLKMIHSRRADYFFISEEEAIELTASSGLLQADFTFIRFANIPQGNKRYLLFSQRVEDPVIEKINTALKISVNDGS